MDDAQGRGPEAAMSGRPRHPWRRVLGAALLTAPGALAAQDRTPPAFVPVTQAVHRDIDGQRAFRMVEYVQRFFRLPGNHGFDAAIDSVASLLRAAGYVPEDSAPPSARLVYRIESRPMRDPAWTPLDAAITLAGHTTPLQQFATNMNMIAINSVSTPEGGVTAPIVDVGAGTEADFARQSVRGRIVLTNGNVRVVQQRAMQQGAAGVLATQQLPAYLQQDKNRRAIQFTGIARDSINPGWLLFVSRASHDSLAAAMRAGPVTATVRISTLLERRPERTLIAEIRGAARPTERFVYSAHVQEPGANDNASGVGALAEMARVAANLVQRGIAAPQRSLTFLWGDEIRSTDRYIKEDSVRRTGIRWGMSLDMVGENTATTGGTFLIEKMPDPSAVWVRGEDQHTEWGGRPLAEKDIRAHWFNDFVRQRCLDRARATGWVVKANPFEGGSDHTPFLNANIPAVLLWHFTDQFYHTDLDRIEQVSATTLGNVGACALTTGLLLADGSRAVTLAALDELTRVAEQTLRTQAALSRDTLARGGSAAHEQHILDTWRDYYLAALDRIPDIASAPFDITQPLNAAKRRLREASQRLSK
jgi:aminopeptidase YwaD